jgi:hypothetical protein
MQGDCNEVSKSRINNIPITNSVQLGIENYIWMWWYTYAILVLRMPIAGSGWRYGKHIRMKVEREGPTLKLTPLNTCLSPNDLWTSLHSMSTSWSSSIWPFKSQFLDKFELYSTCPRKKIRQYKLHFMAIQLNTQKISTKLQVHTSCRLSTLPKPGLLAAKTGPRPVCNLLNGMSLILQKEEMEWTTTASSFYRTTALMSRILTTKYMWLSKLISYT